MTNCPQPTSPALVRRRDSLGVDDVQIEQTEPETAGSNSRAPVRQVRALRRITSVSASLITRTVMQQAPAATPRRRSPTEAPDLAKIVRFGAQTDHRACCPIAEDGGRRQLTGSAPAGAEAGVDHRSGTWSCVYGVSRFRFDDHGPRPPAAATRGPADRPPTGDGIRQHPHIRPFPRPSGAHGWT